MDHPSHHWAVESSTLHEVALSSNVEASTKEVEMSTLRSSNIAMGNPVIFFDYPSIFVSICRCCPFYKVWRNAFPVTTKTTRRPLQTPSLEKRAEKRRFGKGLSLPPSEDSSKVMVRMINPPQLSINGWMIKPFPGSSLRALSQSLRKCHEDKVGPWIAIFAEESHVKSNEKWRSGSPIESPAVKNSSDLWMFNP